LDEALAQDRFELIEALQAVALDSARQAKSIELIKQVVARGRERDALRGEYEQVAAARKTLDESPTDPEANLLVGKYSCFVKGDWDTGLPMLALGSDAA